jgi:Putative antitoxin
MCVNTLKHITVKEENYYILKRLGNAGDSFNDVITQLLNKLELLQQQTDSRVGPFHQSAAAARENPTKNNTVEDDAKAG